MKKLIVIFLFASLGCQAQNWADSLAKFERKDSKKTYGWFDSLTNTNQTQHLQEWYSLKIKVSIQTRLLKLADNTVQSNGELTNRQAYILHLQGLTFACENSRADWRKAYNHPEWFVSTWQSKADLAWTASKIENGGNGLTDFLNFCRQYDY